MFDGGGFGNQQSGQGLFNFSTPATTTQSQVPSTVAPSFSFGVAASNQPLTFGGFGAPSTTSSSSVFSGFGPQQAAGSSAPFTFGSTQSAPVAPASTAAQHFGGFGTQPGSQASSTFSTFASLQNAPGTSLFSGSTLPVQPTTTSGTSISFGAPTTATPNLFPGGFGASQTAPTFGSNFSATAPAPVASASAPAGFAGFGQTHQSATASSVFGLPTTVASSFSTGPVFGEPVAPSAQTGTSAFSFGQTASTSAALTGSLFGQPTIGTSGSLFSQQPSNAFSFHGSSASANVAPVATATPAVTGFSLLPGTTASTTSQSTGPTLGFSLAISQPSQSVATSTPATSLRSLFGTTAPAPSSASAFSLNFNQTQGSQTAAPASSTASSAFSFGAQPIVPAPGQSQSGFAQLSAAAPAKSTLSSAPSFGFLASPSTAVTTALAVTPSSGFTFIGAPVTTAAPTTSNTVPLTTSSQPSQPSFGFSLPNISSATPASTPFTHALSTIPISLPISQPNAGSSTAATTVVFTTGTTPTATSSSQGSGSVTLSSINAAPMTSTVTATASSLAPTGSDSGLTDEEKRFMEKLKKMTYQDFENYLEDSKRAIDQLEESWIKAGLKLNAFLLMRKENTKAMRLLRSKIRSVWDYESKVEKTLAAVGVSMSEIEETLNQLEKINIDPDDYLKKNARRISAEDRYRANCYATLDLLYREVRIALADVDVSRKKLMKNLIKEDNVRDLLFSQQMLSGQIEPRLLMENPHILGTVSAFMMKQTKEVRNGQRQALNKLRSQNVQANAAISR